MTSDWLTSSFQPIFYKRQTRRFDRQGRASQETHQYVGLRTCRTCLDWPSTILPQLLKLHAEPACSDTVWEPFRHNQWTIFRVLPFSAHLNISRVFRNTLIMQVELGERNPNQRSINRLQYGHPPNYPVFQNPPVIASVCMCERTLNPQNAELQEVFLRVQTLNSQCIWKTRASKPWVWAHFPVAMASHNQNDMTFLGYTWSLD